MSKAPATKLPTYRLHKPSGQARVRWQGREIWLGKYDSDDCRKRYAELLIEIVNGTTIDHNDAKSKHSASGTSVGKVLSVNELCVAFLEHAEKHYCSPGTNKPTAEFDCFLSVITPLKELFGLTPVNSFGPLALKTVREKMVEKGWCRRYVNRSVSRIRQIFKFGVENEWVEPDVLQKLKAVAPLLRGRCEAPDYEPRSAVDQKDIDAVRDRVSELCRDLIDLQLLCGARPGELLGLRWSMIVKGDGIWTAELREHKTAHKGKSRKLTFGARAILILRKYISAKPDAKLFGITREGYCHAIKRACAQLGIKRWTPHWLRHNVATMVRDQFGVESAQALLGHSESSTTDRYAIRMDDLAAKVAKTIG